MKKICFSFAIVTFSFLVLTPISISAQQVNTINGTVFSKSTKRPIADLWVQLVNDFNVAVFRERTTTSGRFIFRGMRAGRYTIKILTSGTEYEEDSRDVEIINTQIGGRTTTDTIYEDFYLKPPKSSNPVRVNQVFFAQDIPKDAEEHFKSALKSIEDKRNDEAISFLRNAIGVFPSYFLALELLGVELIKQNKYSEAWDIFSRSTSVNPKSFQGWYGLAYAGSALGKTTESIGFARKAVEISPNAAEGYIILGLALRTDKQFKDSEAALVKAKAIANNKNASVNWNLALLYYYNLKLYKEAANELESYLKLSPDLPKPEVENLRKLIIKCHELQKQEQP
jgi:tetratricopeptide (TPR) repeat protein